MQLIRQRFHLLIAFATFLVIYIAPHPGIATSVQYASEGPANRYLDAPGLVGTAKLKVMLWEIFDAQLYAQNGNFSPEKPFALRLTYLRNIPGEKIAEKSIEEIQAQAEATDTEVRRWRKMLSEIIPDVTKSTTITGIRTAEAHTVFYMNNERIGKIEDQRFTRLFFNIWLGENASEPGLRSQLIGASQS